MRTANKRAGFAVANRMEFEGSNLRGIGWDGGARSMPTHTGWMPETPREAYLAEVNEGCVDYVVYSYGTPIAWHSIQFGWVMPPVKYSATTGRHQSIVRRGIQAAA